MLCLNLFASRLKINGQTRELFHVWEDLKLNHHHLVQPAAPWSNFIFFVAKTWKRKIINGIPLQTVLLISLKKYQEISNVEGRSPKKKFATIASIVWNMKPLLKQHCLWRKSCHWRKLIMVERWKSNHTFGIKLEALMKRLFVALANHITEEVISRKEALFVADLNRFYGELVNDLADMINQTSAIMPEN